MGLSRLDGEGLFFFFDFFVDGGYHLVSAAFGACFREFFEHVVAALEFSDSFVVAASVGAADGCHDFWDFDFYCCCVLTSGLE